MTILMYISAVNFGGAERYFLRLIEHLRSKGHRVLIVAVKNTPLHEELRKRNFEVHAWPRPNRHNIALLMKLCFLVRREKVVLINTHLTRASLAGTIVGKWTGVPVVSRIAAVGDRFPQHAPHFIAVADGVREYLINEGVEPQKIQVIYNGIDSKKYSRSLPVAAAKAQLGFSDEDFVVGIVANLRERKGHRHLFQAAANLLSAIPRLHLLCIGDDKDDYQVELAGLATKLKIAKHVHFLGKRDDIPEILAGCDVFVLPSLQEGLSNALMEAMALGCPVIATDVGGHSEIVKHEQTGLLIPAADEIALRNAILRISTDRPLSQKLADEGQQFIRQHFNQQQWLERAEAHLLKLAQTQKKRVA